MHKKALTVAIAGALAAPMAAQAVDFSISGHVNRALVVVDTDDGTEGAVVNNGSSSTRVRWTGSSEMMDGNSVGIQVEYQETGDGSLGLRHANIKYSGEFGKVTIGQGSEAGDGSAYKGGVGTFGVGHGQEKGPSFSLGAYFGSLDAGGRINMIRYDTPALGPVGAAVSVGNDDSISAAATLSTDFSGSSFNAMIASLQVPGDTATIGASAGVSMANGLGVSGAWGMGESMGDNATDPSYFQAAIAYSFGDSTVSASWYSSEDFANEGSEGTALGVGVNHNLPKVAAQVYAAVQNYAVEDGDHGRGRDRLRRRNPRQVLVGLGYSNLSKALPLLRGGPFSFQPPEQGRPVPAKSRRSDWSSAVRPERLGAMDRGEGACGMLPETGAARTPRPSR